MSELSYIPPRYRPTDVYVPQTLQQQCEYVFTMTWLSDLLLQHILTL